MADVVQKAKLKSPYTGRLNPRYAVSVNAEQKRRQAEAFEAMNAFVRKHGGAIVSPPGRFVRIECPKDSLLPTKLRELGYVTAGHGSVTRITGAPAISPKLERLTHAVPSAFCEMDVYEIRLDGR